MTCVCHVGSCLICVPGPTTSMRTCRAPSQPGLDTPRGALCNLRKPRIYTGLTRPTDSDKDFVIADATASDPSMRAGDLNGRRELMTIDFSCADRTSRRSLWRLLSGRDNGGG